MSRREGLRYLRGVRILYHFPQSPFSRRARFFLAEKGIEVELRDARGDATHHEQAKRLSPMSTLPVLVDDDGAVLGDSFAIAAYAERLVPSPRLFPGPESAPSDVRAVWQSVALCDAALTHIVDVGTRYHSLFDGAGDGGAAVREAMVGRAVGAIDELSRVIGQRDVLGRQTIDAAGFGIADIWITSLALWLDRLPARRGESANIDRILDLGVTLPVAVARFAKAHADRPTCPR